MLNKDFIVKFPENTEGALSQNQEYCIIQTKRDKSTFNIKLHEYDKIYSIPGLYEHIFLEKLKYCSPEKICRLLKKETERDLAKPEELHILDLGAGNGIAGEWLRDFGFKNIYGIDIEHEAKNAVKRDRPNVYKNFYAADLMQLPNSLQKELNETPFNCLVSVGSLGFGDIPPEVFVKGFNLLANPAWVAFNIKQDFLLENDPTGFSYLIRKMADNGILEIRSRLRYCHRLSVCGEPLYYFAVSGIKKSDISDELLKNRFE